jgi:hypothetical protein
LPSIFSLDPGIDRHERRGKSRLRADMNQQRTKTDRKRSHPRNPPLRAKIRTAEILNDRILNDRMRLLCGASP